MIAVIACVVAGGVAGTAYAFGGAFRTGDASPPRPSTVLRERLNDRPSAVLSIAATTARRTVTPGAAVSFAVHIRRGAPLVHEARLGRRRELAPIWVSARPPLPAGVSAAFAPRATRSPVSILTLRTSPRLRPGTYRVPVRARGRFHARPRYRMREAWTTLTLIVPALPHRAFDLRGTLARPLAPGVSSPVDVRLTNPYRSAMRVHRITVRVARIHAPASDTGRRCTLADFAVTPFTAARGFVVPRHSTRSLRALRVPTRDWPHVAMRNRSVNQDGCKGATLTLGFTAAAIGGPA